MHHGYISCACAAPALRVADCAYNAAETVKWLEEAHAQGVQLLVFPELGLTGYTCGELFLQKTLLDGAMDALMTVKEATEGKSMVVFVGLPVQWNHKLYNCAVL